MIESENIVVAIGVCSKAAELAYNVNFETQSKEWHTLRSAIYHLTELLEQVAKQEVTA